MPVNFKCNLPVCSGKTTPCPSPMLSLLYYACICYRYSIMLSLLYYASIIHLFNKLKNQAEENPLAE